MIEITDGATPETLEQTRQLFLEYASWIEISLCFQGFDTELAELPGKYAPPKGRLFLASCNDRLAGCVALRPLGEGICEMKRLYVRPEFRGAGVGRHLMAAIIDAAREIGYERMRLDTLPQKMDQALAMYRRHGFKEIPPYYENPVKGATFMELQL
jgi:ribosomal protein S18 acetylase RimI-like enzyme